MYKIDKIGISYSNKHLLTNINKLLISLIILFIMLNIYKSFLTLIRIKKK